MPAPYLRFPSLHGATVTFVCDDDLWQVGTDGGIARRLTAGLSEPATPCVSPDGRWLAFIGRDEQHPEVYLMPAEGGPARRLTWLGPDALVRGWTPEGHILFVSTHGQPFFRNHRAYTLDPAGGTPKLLPLGQVNHLAFGPANATGQPMVIGRNTADPARWKRYRGGTAGHLWIDTEGSGSFRRMTELTGNITSPMWLGDRIYYLSDSDGVANLHSCRPNGSDPRSHTDHTAFYARHAQTDGRRIVYQCGADLWLFDPATDHNTQIEIATPAHQTQVARRFVSAADHLGGMRLHPKGHSVALDVRGQLFSLALWEGAVRHHGRPVPGSDVERLPSERLRLGQWLADGTTLVAVGDADGEEHLCVFDPKRDADANAARCLPWDLGRITTLRAAPIGTRVAIANHRNEVWIGDVASGELTAVDRSEFGRTDDLDWASDGRWLAYSYRTSLRHSGIKLYGLASATATLVTQAEFIDYSPSFDPAGKYLYFLSLRTFDPVYDSVHFELSFPRGARPYLIALQAGGAPPFEPVPKGLGDDPADVEKVADEAEAGVATTTAAAAKPKPVPTPLQIDLDGIARRIAQFPVPENRFGKLAGAIGGRVVWSELELVGAHGRGDHKTSAGRLAVFDFATGRTDTLADKVDDFEIAADHTTLLLREGKRLRAIDVRKKLEPDKSPEGAGGAPSRRNGWLDLGRIRPQILPRAEWRQMFREVWRLQRDQFWDANMSGIDWPSVYDRYVPLVERVATRGELSDLIWELQGELGTSHAYESGGDHRKPPAVALGSLAADLRFDPADQSYEIVHIVIGDAWDAGADSPLNAVGVEARVGERIVAVDGQRVSAELPPQALLVNQADTRVELTLRSAPGDAAVAGSSATRRVLIRTLADEVPARYREWVERNRAWVHEASVGRVGYLHLPDMMSAGYAEFHRYFIAECDRDALIVDVRYNRGGHVSPLLLEKIARKRIGHDHSRWGRPTPYPPEAVAGPVVALTNEHAGSDGDIFSHSMKLMGIGTLVGTRTWGGVIGIWPRHGLVDGSTTTQPEFSFWFSDVGWGVENHGTDPQIEIDNAPQDAASGTDRQLQVALATALEQADRHPRLPDAGPRPDLAAPGRPGPAR